MVVVNVFGLGVFYHVLELPIALVTRIEEVAKQAKVSFSDVFFDFDLIEKCGYFSFADLPKQTQGLGCFIFDENFLEIRKERKKLNQFRLLDIISQNYLFPMYRTKEKNFEITRKEGVSYFFLYQVIKGRVLKYGMDSFKSMDELTFEITNFNLENKQIKLLTGLQNNEECLLSEKDDSVVIESKVIRF